MLVIRLISLSLIISSSIRAIKMRPVSDKQSRTVTNFVSLYFLNELDSFYLFTSSIISGLPSGEGERRGGLETATPTHAMSNK